MRAAGGGGVGCWRDIRRRDENGGGYLGEEQADRDGDLGNWRGTSVGGGGGDGVINGAGKEKGIGGGE